MKRTVIYIVMLMLSLTGAFAATPAQMLAAASKKLSEAPSVSASFTMLTNGGRGGNATGTMQMARKACMVSAGGITMWYDGSTQWVYSVATQEVNVSKPTAEDLMESNPFMLITGYASHFNVASGGAGKVVLTPKDKQRSGIEKATVAFDSKGWPSKINVRFQNDSTIDISVSKISIGKALPASAFRFDPKKYPEAEVIDLR